MTRPSRREIERTLESIEGEKHGTDEFLMATVKDVHDSQLSAAEKRLLNDPETHLSESALRALDEWASGTNFSGY